MVNLTKVPAYQFTEYEPENREFLRTPLLLISKYFDVKSNYNELRAAK